MANFFKFGDKTTLDFDMHVERYPKQIGARRRSNTVSVPGRNGDLHFLEDAFDNYTQPYECYFHGSLPMPEQAHGVKTWLLRSGSYQRLEDTYDPKYFRLASFLGPIDIENTLNKYGRCTVLFDCAPQSFLKSGEYPVPFDAPGILVNPTEFAALPLITVYGSDAGSVTIGNRTVTIKSIEDRIVLDCDLQHAYRQTGEAAPENMNAHISAPEFPKLLAGENPISWTGGIERIEIIPRWWTL